MLSHNGITVESGGYFDHLMISQYTNSFTPANPDNPKTLTPVARAFFRTLTNPYPTIKL